VRRESAGYARNCPGLPFRWPHRLARRFVDRHVDPEAAALARSAGEADWPPIRSTSLRVNARPTPVPSIAVWAAPSRLKGWNSSPWRSGGIPMPVSMTVIRSQFASIASQVKVTVRAGDYI